MIFGRTLAAAALSLRVAPRTGGANMGVSVDADIERWLELNVGSGVTRKALGGSGWASFSRYSVDGAESDLFIKTSRRSVDEMFFGEALGLKALHATQTVTVPKVPPLMHTAQSCHSITAPSNRWHAPCVGAPLRRWHRLRLFYHHGVP